MTLKHIWQLIGHIFAASSSMPSSFTHDTYILTSIPIYRDILIHKNQCFYIFSHHRILGLVTWLWWSLAKLLFPHFRSTIKSNRLIDQWEDVHLLLISTSIECSFKRFHCISLRSSYSFMDLYLNNFSGGGFFLSNCKINNKYIRSDITAH